MHEHDSCPACGHMLSSYQDAEATRGERLATAAADIHRLDAKLDELGGLIESLRDGR